MMKNEAISQIELILPAAVVEACYKLKRAAGSKFRALDKTAGTSSDIVLFKQPDDSVCINISVTRICIDDSNNEDTSEIFKSQDANPVRSESVSRRGGRQGRSAVRNNRAKNGLEEVLSPGVTIARRGTARRARGKWRGGLQRVNKRRENFAKEPEQEEVNTDTCGSADGPAIPTANGQHEPDKTKHLSQISDALDTKESKDAEKLNPTPKGRRKKTQVTENNHIRKQRFSGRRRQDTNLNQATLQTSNLRTTEKLDKQETQVATKPKKMLQKKPAVKRNLKKQSVTGKRLGRPPKKAVMESKEVEISQLSESELLNADPSKKLKKSSDKLANIWGRKRKRKTNKKAKTNQEEESPENNAHSDVEKIAVHDNFIDNQIRVLHNSPQNGIDYKETNPENLAIETAENIIAPIAEPVSHILNHSDDAMNHHLEMTHESYMQPHCDYTQPDNCPENYMYNLQTVPHQDSTLESLHPQNHLHKQDYDRNHGPYMEVNECFPPAPQPGFLKNTYEPLSLETTFESNMHPGYDIGEEEVQHITLTNVSDNMAEESQMTHMTEEHLKLPQKKRPLARQMVDPDVPIQEWETDPQANMLEDTNDSAAQAELEMSVHTLQSVMATGEDESSMELGVDDDSRQENGSDSNEIKASPGTQKKAYKREHRIQCRICQVKVKDYAYLFRHIGKLHQDMPDHRAYMEEIRPLMRTPCNICGITVSSISNLASHMRQKHSDSSDMVNCTLCQKVYKTANSLKQHMRICHAEEEKRHVCDICQAKFAEKRGLEEHINCSHVTTKVFNCEVCGKTFLTKGRLRRHLLIHGEFRYKCNYCEKGFHLRDNMNKHVEIVHEKQQGKRFECQYCSKKFSVKGNMMQHVLGVHLKKYQYSCSLCDMGFRRKGDLLKHVEQKHPQNVGESVIDLSGSDSQSGSFEVPMAAETDMPNPSSPLMICPNPPTDEIIHTQVLTPAML